MFEGAAASCAQGQEVPQVYLRVLLSSPVIGRRTWRVHHPRIKPGLRFLRVIGSYSEDDDQPASPKLATGQLADDVIRIDAVAG